MTEPSTGIRSLDELINGLRYDALRQVLGISTTASPQGAAPPYRVSRRGGRTPRRIAPGMVAEELANTHGQDVLHAGDAILLNQEPIASWRNAGPEEAELLWTVFVDA